MKYNKIKIEKAEELLLAAGLPAIIESDGTSIKAIRITIGDTHLKVAVGNYSVDLWIPEAKELTEVTVDFGADDLPNGVKTFENEGLANDWIADLKNKYQTALSDWQIHKRQVFKRAPDTFLVSLEHAQEIAKAGQLALEGVGVS